MKNLSGIINVKPPGKGASSKKAANAVLLLLAAALTIIICLHTPGRSKAVAAPGDYIVLAWSDQGMHFYYPDFKTLAFAPPYNTLRAQVIRMSDPPQVVTGGITVEYSFPANTYSVNLPKAKGRQDKTNFWTYATPLFGVTVTPNIGLAGKGLAGQMDLNGDHFIAEGIPLTEFNDLDAKKKITVKSKRTPYQLATVIVKDAATGAELARTQTVSAVSTEVSCGTCHSNKGSVSAMYPTSKTGKTDTNILKLHDIINGTDLLNSRPVLCTRCHASNAPGVNTPGFSGTPSFSNAIHRRHKGWVSSDTSGCYNCHPGPVTQGTRDLMTAQLGFQCTNCHDTMAEIAANTAPWQNVPRCDSAACHSTVTQDQPRFGLSKGHEENRIYCAGCHDSAHALTPSAQPNDNIKFIALQGTPGALNCSVCHVNR